MRRPRPSLAASWGLLPPDSRSGLLRGALPQGATTGVVRGTLPPGGTAGLIQSVPPGAQFGVLRDTSSAARVPVMPAGVPPDAHARSHEAPFRQMRSSALSRRRFRRGRVSGSRGPAEIVQGLDSQARMYLEDGNYAHGEGMLNGSVAIREDMMGRSIRRSPEPSRRRSALRHYSRDAAATDMEARAKEIRTKLEPPPAPKRPDRF